MADEVMEVQPELIEDELSPLTRADAWLAEVSERVARLCEQYRPPEEIGSRQQYTDAKKARASANGYLKGIGSERTEMLRSTKEAIKRFEAQAKDVASPLQDVVDRYDASIKPYEERWRAERSAELAEAYGEYAPDLVPLVPFERLLQAYGSEKGTGWLLMGTNIEAAKDMLAEAVRRVAKGEQRIERFVAEEDREVVKALYFSTLDIDAAMDRAEELADQRERVRAMEAERMAREEEERRIAEEAERQRLAEEAMADEQPQPWGTHSAPSVEPAATPQPQPSHVTLTPSNKMRVVDVPQPHRKLETGTVLTPEQYRAEYEQVTGRPAPMSVVEQAAVTAGSPMPGQVPDYVFCGYGTEAQALAFVEWCNRNGVSRRTKLPTKGRQFKLTTR